MPTVGQLIERVMPRGTVYFSPGRKPEPRWDDPPSWPPDVFAVAATLVKHSECYAHRAVRGGTGLGSDHARTSRTIGRRWSMQPEAPSVRAALTSEWNNLRKAWKVAVSECMREDDRLAPWAVSALRLLAYADEACRGVGFGTPSLVADIAEAVSFDNYNQTITLLVDPTECCVLPKGRTPMVGCNLRSLSLHVALLPPITMVDSLHIDAPIRPKAKTRSLGVLLIPFPYVVDNKDFARRSITKQNWGNVRLACSWGHKPRPQLLAHFVDELIREAAKGKEGGAADIVVLPELALSTAQRRAVWQVLRKRGTQLLLCGVHDSGPSGRLNLASGMIRGHSPA